MLPILLLFFVAPLFAQFDPESAKALVYIPQLADGGDTVQRWQTSIQILNSSTFSARCRLDFIAPTGQPMAMDFGGGAAASANVVVPPGGRVTLRSQGLNPQIRTGWATGFCTYPVSTNVLFRQIDRGRDAVEIAASAATPSPIYRSAANRDLGIAIANVYAATPIQVTLRALNNEGREMAARSISVCPRCQTTGNLGTWLPSLPTAFEGSIVMAGDAPSSVFVAWTLHAERGLLAPLPKGALSWPVSHVDRIWEHWFKLLNHAMALFPDAGLESAKLNIGYEPIINAFARSSHEVTINLALSQLISDSPSELASVIAHEIAHLVQFRRGGAVLLPNNGNRELDADAVSTILLLIAGYDPYASAGAFGKLMMASRRTGLLQQAFDDLSDPHTSFSTRMGLQMELLDLVCQVPEVRSQCIRYKQYIHPNFPDSLPLNVPRPGPPASFSVPK